MLYEDFYANFLGMFPQDGFACKVLPVLFWEEYFSAEHVVAPNKRATFPASLVAKCGQGTKFWPKMCALVSRGCCNKLRQREVAWNSTHVSHVSNQRSDLVERPFPVFKASSSLEFLFLSLSLPSLLLPLHPLLSLSSLPLSHKDPCDYFGPTWIISPSWDP